MEDVPHSVEDFGQYYEAMDEALDKLEEEVIGSHEQPDVELLPIAGEGKAEDHLQMLNYHRSELWRVLCHSELETDKIEAWRIQQDQLICRRIAWHERCLEAWFTSTGAKSANLINGKLKNIKGRERVEIVDEDAIPAEYKNETITYSPDKKRILAALRESGEIVEGTEVVRGEDHIKIDTPDDAV
jgi:hypothetical protein